jgi:Transposase DDE domain
VTDSHWRARCWETGTAGSEGDHAEKDQRKLAPRRVVDPTAHLMARRHGGRRARVRGTVKVAADFALLGAATNLRRLAVLMVRSDLGGAWVAG